MIQALLRTVEASVAEGTPPSGASSPHGGPARRKALLTLNYVLSRPTSYGNGTSFNSYCTGTLVMSTGVS